MPLYRCLVRQGSTTFEQRDEIAKEVVRVHCGVTGAPPSFVHAFFSEDANDELPADIERLEQLAGRDFSAWKPRDRAASAGRESTSA